MRYLVTGGTGFIGTFVTSQLVRSGNTVITYSRSPDLKLLEPLLNARELKSVIPVAGDMIEASKLVQTMREQKVEMIIHLSASLFGPSTSNPLQAIRTNIEGTNYLLDAAVTLGIKRIVWASSSAVFGPKSSGSDGVVANDAALDPQGVYGACKVVNEQVASHYAQKHGLEPVGLRLPVIYGPKAVRGGTTWLSIMIENLVKGKPAEAPTGLRTFTLLYADDAAEAVAMAAQATNHKSLVYNLSGDVSTQQQLLDTVARFFPDAEIHLYEQKTTGSVSIPPQFDDRVIRKELGWRPRHSLEEGIRASIDFYRSSKVNP